MGDEAARAEIKRSLMAGLITQADERPTTGDEINAIVARLQSIAPADRQARLVVAGFLTHPYAIQEDGLVEACETCMYFELHRRWCNLPELALPVEPEWSCRLWRI